MALVDDAQNETSLLEKAGNGDCAAFQALFDGYYPMIYSFIYRLCLNRCDAEDLAQETFVKAARSLGSFQKRSSFKNWLFQIAINVNRDWFRSRARKTRTVAAYENEARMEETVRSPDWELVRDALSTLAEDLRQAVVLVFYEDLSHAEAAQILGCAETTVSWRIFRAKQKLRPVLSRTAEPEEAI